MLDTLAFGFTWCMSAKAPVTCGAAIEVARETQAAPRLCGLDAGSRREKLHEGRVVGGLVERIVLQRVSDRNGARHAGRFAVKSR